MGSAKLTSIIAINLLLVQSAIGQVVPVPTTLNDFFLPGSQPNQSGNLESPDKCDNCHGGYDIEVEPAFNWRGSMMSQAARDPLFFACLAISNQDAPQSGDLCLRCHTPPGWLGGRSVPTDGSALVASDREGVQCDYCHKMVKPTELGVNPYPDDSVYTEDTYPRDQTYLATIDSIPETCADGMYIADSDNAKRGPFVDANARHQMFYSPFHQDSSFCGTCHDVSNPAYTDDGTGNYLPNSFDQPAPDFDPYTMFPIERTFSEWKMSAYNTPQGVYAPQFGGNKDTVSTCQDCHLRDITGEGCNKNGTPTRQDLPFHDMTGGNTFIPKLIDALFPGETDPAALDSGIVRARYMLQHAATMNLSSTQQGSSHLLNVNIINETAHKLPSGYPEGRRIWINVKAYNNNGTLIYESGAYDTSTAVLTHDSDVKIYEIKPGISNDLSPIVNLPVGPSFHFVINDTVFSDNRIPPRGFTNSNFEMIQSPPVGYSYADGQFSDDTEYLVPGAAAKIVVTLNYQTTSKEYVEFLRDENHTNDWGDVFYDLWATNGKSTPVAMNIDSVFVDPMVQGSPPVALCRDTTVYADTDCVAFASINNDSYDPDGDSITLVQEPAPPYPLGQTLVSLIVTDTTGLSDTCQGTVTVIDSTAPHLACPPDMIFDCTLGDPGTATASDNCDPDPAVSYSDSILNADCPTVIERTWTAVDSSGNLSSCVQIIAVQDTAAPLLACPADTTFECVMSDAGTATATDNCDSHPVIDFADVTVNSSCPVLIERTWTATDSCGNFSTCVQTITIEDTLAPQIICPNDIIFDCVMGDPGAAYAYDNCDPDPAITYSDSTLNTRCPLVIERTWTATDSCGNFSTCVQMITVQDITAPLLTCPADTTLECVMSGAGIATATDNCDPDPVIEFSDIIVTTSCPAVIERTWTATDSCGNFSTCVQTITIADTIAPLVICPNDIIFFCVMGDPGTAYAYDNCDPDPAITYSDSTLNARCPLVIERTWTATDSCGLISSCVQIITVEDTTRPELSCPADTSIANDPGQCGATLAFIPYAADNCYLDTIITNPPFGSFLPAGITPVEAIARDSCGNEDTCYFDVTVIDNEPPSASCPADTVILLGPDQDSVMVDFTISASDNCEVDTVQAFPAPGSWFGVGTATVTVSATDIYGNADTCYFDITVTANPADIPTLSEWGMLIMALLLLALGTVAIIRKREVVSAKGD